MDPRRPSRAAGALGAASPRGSRPRSPGKLSGRSTAASFRCLLSRGSRAGERGFLSLRTGCESRLCENAGPQSLRVLQGLNKDGKDAARGKEGKAPRPIIFTSVFFLFLLTTQQAPAGAEGSRKSLLEVFPFVAFSLGISPQVALNVLGFSSKSVLSEKLPAAQGGRAEGCAGRVWRVSQGWLVRSGWLCPLPAGAGTLSHFQGAPHPGPPMEGV